MPIGHLNKTGVEKKFERLCLNFAGSMPEHHFLQAICLRSKQMNCLNLIETGQVIRIRQTGVEKNCHHFWTGIMSRGGTTSKTQFAVTIDPHKSVIPVGYHWGHKWCYRYHWGHKWCYPNTTWHHYVVTSGDTTFAGSMPELQATN